MKAYVFILRMGDVCQIAMWRLQWNITMDDDILANKFGSISPYCCP